jgi:ABC-type nitrate/sulfonate/bicarbonate transport system permease component
MGVWIALVEWLNSGELMADFAASIWRLLLGLTVGSMLGILLGLFTGRSAWLNATLSPLLNFLKAIPPVSMLPIIITFWGVGDESKILSISLATIFPLWVNTHMGAYSVPKEYLRSAQLMSPSSISTLVTVVLPASLGSILTGFRLSLAMGFIMLYVSELAGASEGLGYRISSSHLSYRMDKMIAALILLGILAFLFDKLMTYAAGKLFPWARIANVI